MDSDWSVKAGSLDWDCWETAEHTADDLFAYALQIGRPLDTTYVPVICEARREGGPRSTIFVEREAGVAGLLQAFEGCGALLASMVRTTSAEVRSFHNSGMSDPDGFGAMGIAEVLLHTHDIAVGLGLEWTPPEDLCDRVLKRLFPDAPTESPRWETLLWSSGRGELPGKDRLTKWTWDSNVR